MEKHIFYLTRNGQVIASGYFDNGSFVVQKGSIHHYATVLSPLCKGQQVLDEDTTFASPSAAGAFCLNKSVNGWVAWKDIEGKTLDSVYRNKTTE